MQVYLFRIDAVHLEGESDAPYCFGILAADEEQARWLLTKMHLATFEGTRESPDYYLVMDEDEGTLH
jgi:hypothetical protein